LHEGHERVRGAQIYSDNAFFRHASFCFALSLRLEL